MGEHDGDLMLGQVVHWWPPNGGMTHAVPDVGQTRTTQIPSDVTCSICLSHLDGALRTFRQAGAHLSLAESVARIAHATQVDLQGRPYADYHLRPIAESVRFLGIPFAAVAWLHDIVEDTTLTLTHLRAVFPDAVVGGVDSVTRRILHNGITIDAGDLAEHGVHAKVHPAKEPYDALIARAAAHSVGCVVKYADNRWNWLNSGLLAESGFYKLGARLRKRYEGAYEPLALAVDERYGTRVRQEILDRLIEHLDRLA